jgi:iron complex outermembrane recepter protein
MLMPARKKNSRILILFLFAFLPVMAMAQQRISGVITDNGNKPLEGVTVTEKGTQNSTATDARGSFSLAVNKNATLVVSSVGMLTEEIPVSSSASAINLSMKEDSKGLSEVVVAALGIKREKKNLGYATSAVKGQEIVKAGSPTVASALYGKVPGLQVNTLQGGATSGVALQLRGINSINFTNMPLIVVDGMPIRNEDMTYSSTSAGGGRIKANGIVDINPQDVESIDVLRGSTASALYGSDGTNGVILITTKSGKKGRGLQIDFNTTQQMDKIAFLPDFQNEFGVGRGPAYISNNNNGWFDLDGSGAPTIANTSNNFGPRMEGQQVKWWDGQIRSFDAQPNNYADLFKTGYTGSNTLSVSTGFDRGALRFGYTRDDWKSTQLAGDFAKNTFSLNTNIQLSKKLGVDIAANYINNKVNNRPLSISGPAGYEFNRSEKTELLLARYKNADGYLPTSTEAPTSGYNVMLYYIWPQLNSNFIDNTDRLIAHGTLTYNILKGLDAKMKVGTDYTSYEEEDMRKWQRPDRSGSSYRRLNQITRINYLESFLQYRRSIIKDLEINAMAGYVRQYAFSSSAQSVTAGGLTVRDWFSISNSVNAATTTNTRGSDLRYSVLGLLGFNYKGFLNLEFTGRNEWNSTLPPANNSYFFPGVNSSFIFSEALQMPAWINYGKLRVSYAQTAKGVSRYSANNAYTFASFNGAPVNTFSTALNNDELKPETKKEYEAGVELRMLKSRLSFEYTYYFNKTIDQIIRLSVAGSSGFATALTNVGEMQNNGHELSISYKAIQSKNFSWDVTATAARNINKVNKLHPVIKSLTLRNIDNGALLYLAEEGKPYGEMYGYKIMTNANGDKVINSQGRYVIDQSKRVRLGNITPKFIGGFINVFTYKNFSLNTTIDYRIGGDLYSSTIHYGRGTGRLKETLQGRDEARGGLPYYIDVVGGTRKVVPLPPGTNTAPNGSTVYHDGMILAGVDANNSKNTVMVTPFDYWNYVYNWNVGDYSGATFDNSYVKMREAVLSYRLTEKHVGKMNLKNIQFSVFGRNLFYIWKNIPHIDPESSLGTNSNALGYEYNATPSIRSYGIRLNVIL